jgi:hypothetical protein
MDDCGACGFIQRSKASGNPSLTHSNIFLLANCFNTSIKTDTPSWLLRDSHYSQHHCASRLTTTEPLITAAGLVFEFLESSAFFNLTVNVQKLRSNHPHLKRLPTLRNHPHQLSL